MIKASITALLAVSLLPLPTLATIYHVDVNGGGDFSAIQPAIDAAAGCDTVLVASGTYVGSLNRNLGFGPKNLVVMSEDGPGSTIIDCQGQDRAFFFNYTGQDTISVVRGFTIRGGYTTDYNGGGIIVGGCGVTIEDCIFEDCAASHNGGALYVAYTQVGANVRNCVFVANTAPYRGGAVLVDHAASRFHGCLFYANTTSDGSDPGFGGGAFMANHTEYGMGWLCQATRCTFVENYSPGLGSGVGAWGSSGGFWVTRCIVAFNNGPGYGFGSDPLIDEFTFSVVFGNEGGDADPGYSVLVREDPLFCSMPTGHFELCENSPALPGGNIYGMLMGFADVGCGDCESPVVETSWGSIKAMYR